MALVKCKECGNENAKSATTCPKCGAKLPKANAVAGCLSVLIVLAILAGIGKAMSGGTSASTTVTPDPVAAPEPAAVVKQVEIGALLAAYKANELAADGAYKGQTVRTSGVIDSIAKTLGSPYLKIGTGADFEIPALTCFLSDDQVSKASALAKGQRVTVVGKVTGLTMDVVMNDCRIE
jgi:hypothetical protein